MAALQRECSTLASTSAGRNNQCNASAYSIGQLVGGGLLDQDHAVACLVDAGVLTGLPERDVRAAVASGMRAGMGKPRVAPKRDR